MITVKTRSIKAACGMVATKDVRYYLNGVLILVREDGAVHVRASDGSLAFDDLMPEQSAFAPADIIIPIDVAKLIGKAKTESVEITMAADGRYECAGQIFTPIDGTFPDIDRIMPERSNKFDNVVNHYDAELLVRCQTAMRIATGFNEAFFKLQNSPCGLVHRSDDKYPRCAVMPLRSSTAFVGN